MATNFLWNPDIAKNLEARTKLDFVLIENPEELTFAGLSDIDPKYVFFQHWSHLVEPEIYEQFECVVFHMTDLPFGRGGSPLQNLITRGIYETKISALRCEEGIDSGPIYLKRSFSLYGSAEEIFIRASQVIENMIVDILDNLPEPMPQKGVPTVFKRRTPDEGDLSSADTLQKVFDTIRMLDAEGYPSAFLNVGPLRFEFTRASLRTDMVMADVRISFEQKRASKKK